ncbi:EAL domain-containing protein [uncultured Aquitalea sp.]|uniref:EAL domain-containing protein n=1 Tax=uncultured Aquitalea sp. TaxID=540272 RepID=UPI0025E1451F|nr:EAL domain-containing protein [uncultured Aquitalea sp.]
MRNLIRAQWSRYALSARPVVVYAVMVCASLLFSLAVAFLYTLTVEKTELRVQGDKLLHQAEQQLNQAGASLARVDAVQVADGCDLPRQLLASVVQATPHARYALKVTPEGHGCTSDMSRMDVPGAMQGGRSLQLVANADGSAVIRLAHRGDWISVIELGPEFLVGWLAQLSDDDVSARFVVGEQYLNSQGAVLPKDAEPAAGIAYAAQSTNGQYGVMLAESWGALWSRTLLYHADALLLAMVTGAVLAWALLRRRVARNSSGWEIAQGIRNKEFFTHYQPIVAAENGECVGVEVLARWRHPVQGAIRSDLFIPAAEDAGLIVPLTRYLIRRVTKELKQVALPPGFFVGINIAAEHLGMPDLVEDCKVLLAVLREKKAVLVLEVSERFPLPEHQVTHRVVQDLRQMGVKLALDDFGIGHADRNYLRRWGFDYLKVEKGYVSALGKDSFKTNILDNLLLTSQQLGVQVIVKGVETQGQQNYLTVKGFEFLQGFYFGKPMTLNHFRQWLYSGITQDRTHVPQRAAGVGKPEAASR